MERRPSITSCICWKLDIVYLYLAIEMKIKFAFLWIFSISKSFIFFSAVLFSATVYSGNIPYCMFVECMHITIKRPKFHFIFGIATGNGWNHPVIMLKLNPEKYLYQLLEIFNTSQRDCSHYPAKIKFYLSCG